MRDTGGVDLHDPASEIRPCPYCYVGQAKNNGCNFVRCENPHCRRPWHFVRGRLRQVDHHDFNPREPGTGREIVPPRRYSVPGDAGYQAGQDMETDFPATEGAIR